MNDQPTILDGIHDLFFGSPWQVLLLGLPLIALVLTCATYVFMPALTALTVRAVTTPTYEQLMGGRLGEALCWIVPNGLAASHRNEAFHAAQWLDSWDYTDADTLQFLATPTYKALTTRATIIVSLPWV